MTMAMHSRCSRAQRRPSDTALTPPSPSLRMASPPSKPRAPPALSTLAILDRTHISTRIAAGQLLVLHPPYVYRIPPAWLKLHPGGDMAILHYVGRDATNEIEAYHTDATMRDRMSRWIVGRVELGEDGWRDMVPPVQLSMWPLPVPKILVELVEEKVDDEEKEVEVGRASLTKEMVDPPCAPLDQLPLTPSYQHHLRQSQRVLQARIKALGLDTPPLFLAGYGPSLVIYSSLLAAFVYLYRSAEGTLGYVAAAVALGAWWHQITFVAHDAGHTALTGDWWTDRVLGIAIANFMGGISIGWWADNHNVHHREHQISLWMGGVLTVSLAVVTNSPEHDPDIQHLPFFAISPKFFGSLRSTYYNRIMEFDGFAKAVLPYQFVFLSIFSLHPDVETSRHNLYYIIMCFARFNLFANSYSFMLNKWPARASPLFNLRLAEFVGIAFFWSWFGLVVKGVEGTGNKVLFVLVSFAVTSPLHVQVRPLPLCPPTID